MQKTLYTIGHSTRELEELISILKSFGITQLVDVRTMPRSRHTPQFNEDALTQELPKHGIQYTHITNLGGLRSTNKNSINKGWHNASFRGYADYMQTKDFIDGLNELLVIANNNVTAIMCAEAVPWRCHRSMIGDALLIRNWHVVDIFDAKKVQDEKITSFAKVDNVTITYPPEAEADTEAEE